MTWFPGHISKCNRINLSLNHTPLSADPLTMAVCYSLTPSIVHFLYCSGILNTYIPILFIISVHMSKFNIATDVLFVLIHTYQASSIIQQWQMHQHSGRLNWNVRESVNQEQHWTWHVRWWHRDEIRFALQSEPAIHLHISTAAIARTAVCLAPRPI